MKDRERRRGGQTIAPNRDLRSWGIAAALVSGMLIAAVGGFVFVSQFLLTPSASTNLATGLERKSLGSAAAPVNVTVYGDFQ